MDFDFTEPSLEARRLLFGVQEKTASEEELVTYLADRKMLHVLEDYISKGYVNPVDLRALREEVARGTERKPGEEDEQDAAYEDIKEEAAYLAKTGDYEGFTNKLKRLFEKNNSLSIKFDAFLCKIRLLLVLERGEELKSVMKQTKDLTELGVDWARKNKFKVYRGLHLMSAKRYEEASRLFLESLSTFEGEELVSYKSLVLYTIFTGMLVLDRRDMNTQMINSSEILEVLREIPMASELLHSFFDCNYVQFMRHLVGFADAFAGDMYLKHQADYFVYFMKVRAYSQLFTSYNSISLGQMAEIFGVSIGYMERDISSMILRGDLVCAINRENMIVYNIVKAGRECTDMIGLADSLSNTIQKLIK